MLILINFPINLSQFFISVFCGKAKIDFLCERLCVDAVVGVPF
jgi:hypothetical protein